MTNERNKKTKQTLIIGDVHACIFELKKLLEACHWEPKKQRLIFVGDLINKGPHSLKVLEFVRKINAEVVVGNHELKFIYGIEKKVKLPSLLTELKTQMLRRKNLSFWMKWLKNLPSFIEGEDFIVVHAGIAPGLSLKETSPYILSHIRTWDGCGEDLNNDQNPAWFELYTGKKLIVFGHWAKRGLVLRENAIGLDTGCVYGKKLSALFLPSRKIISIQSERAYAPIS